MILENNIEGQIILLLQNGAMPTVKIIAHLNKKGVATTKQGVYKSIAKLKKEEVLVGFDKKVALNKLWVQKMNAFFSLANSRYGNSVLDGSFLHLEEGDKISYRFKNPYVTDQFWGHAFALLSSMTPPNIPIIIYNPHEWFMLARRQAEEVLFKNLSNEGKLLLITVGSDTFLDKVVKKFFDQKQTQYHIDTKANMANNYYMNIFGDFIIEVRLDKSVANELDKYYQATNELVQNTTEDIKRIVMQPGYNRLTISRSPTRARILRKKLSKHFFIPSKFNI